MDLWTERLHLREFELEDSLRENEHFRDRWWDTLLFGLLVTEWAAG